MNSKEEEYMIPNGSRKSQRIKKPVQRVQEKKTKRSRRRQKDSQQQYVLPEVIPISKEQSIMTFKSFERETSKIIIQLPYFLFKKEQINQTTSIMVESTQIEMKLNLKDPETISISAKISPIPLLLQETGNQKVYKIWGKTSWVSNEVSTKNVNQVLKTITSEFRQIIKVKIAQCQSDIFFVINFRENIASLSKYSGLINQGNTCYMNSYLQMLNYIAQFRNLVFEANVEDPNKFPATLQLLFYRLGNDQKSVSAESLVKSFGWSKKQAQIQQDAQQFSCLFFQALERKLEQACPQSTHFNMQQLFQGRLLHYIQCTNVDFRSNKDEKFFDIQLSISKNLENSLDQYMSQQILSGENMYYTQDYGKQEAKKGTFFRLFLGVRIQVLPPILMIQLKRFQFSPLTYENEKVLERFEYPKEINFSKWLVSQEDQEYQLYSVLVHEGVLAESGHYYVYVQIDDKWWKFNDQQVTEVPEQRVFEYNYGGMISVIDLDSRQMKINNREIVSSSTAYMLVYVKKNLKDRLINSKTEYPQWLRERQILKMQEKQEQKARKNFYHDIMCLNWNQLERRDANFIGLIDREYPFEELGKISKSQKVSEWIKPYNEKGEGVFMYGVNADKIQNQFVVNLQGKTGSFQEVVRQAYYPTFLFLPLNLTNTSYLVFIKLHQITVDNSSLQYHSIMGIDKASSNADLHELLLKKFQLVGFKTKFYFEEKKALTPILPNNSLLLGPQSVRNCMIIVIVQRKSLELPQDSHPTEDWYDKQKNTIQLIVRSENNKYEIIFTINQNTHIQELRDMIFSQKLEQDDDYLSAQNIILKSKPKKGSKVFAEHNQAKTIKDLIKVCDKEKIILFCPSTLNPKERLSQMELKIRYRFQNLMLSPYYTIILKKQANSEESFYENIQKNENIRTCMDKQNIKDIKIFVFSKDSLIINDIIDVNGLVSGKGNIITYLQKTKNPNIVIQGIVSSQKGEDKYPVLIHHLSNSGDKLGRPRYLEFNRNIKLSELREEIVQILKDQVYQWEEKMFSFNPMKIDVLGYTKDAKRSIQICENFDEEEISQILKDKNEVKVSEVKSQSDKDSSNKLEDSLIPNQPKAQQNGKNKQKKEEVDCKNEKQQKELKVKEEKTLEKAFTKAKLIRVAIIHNYLIKSANPMKLHIE